MTRPIKFRAWNKKDKEMIVGFPLDALRQNRSFIDVSPYGNSGGGVIEIKEVKNIIVMQFTGLLDKNGKEIYEHDILMFEKKGKQVRKDYWVVSWSEKGKWVMERLGTRQSLWSNDGAGGNHAKNHEVVGNIYENPNLIQ